MTFKCQHAWTIHNHAYGHMDEWLLYHRWQRVAMCTVCWWGWMETKSSTKLWKVDDLNGKKKFQIVTPFDEEEDEQVELRRCEKIKWKKNKQVSTKPTVSKEKREKSGKL